MQFKVLKKACSNDHRDWVSLGMLLGVECKEVVITVVEEETRLEQWLKRKNGFRTFKPPLYSGGHCFENVSFGRCHNIRRVEGLYVTVRTSPKQFLEGAPGSPFSLFSPTFALL